jgi:hypothetical protein
MRDDKSAALINVPLNLMIFLRVMVKTDVFSERNRQPRKTKIFLFSEISFKLAAQPGNCRPIDERVCSYA